MKNSPTKVRYTTGIEPLKNSIRIWWRINGVRHRATMDFAPTAENLLLAKAMAANIKRELEAGVFDKFKTFPHLKPTQDEVFGFYLDQYIHHELVLAAPSTQRTHLSKIENHIRPHWQNIPIQQITTPMFEQWVNEVLAVSLGNKTIKDILSIWRASWARWARQQDNASDPTAYIKLPQKDSQEIDPYTKDEIRAILATDSEYHNLWVAMLYSGLSTHEMLALAVQDVDLKNGCLYVKRGVVDDVIKATKNRRRKRQVALLPMVIAALTDQISKINQKSNTVWVLERDHRTKTAQRLTWLWQSEDGKPLSYKQVAIRWQNHLKLSGVRYRSLNNARHTYASQVLSTGAVSAEWLANQLGHTDTQMIHKHYGKFIPKDSSHIIHRLAVAIA